MPASGAFLCHGKRHSGCCFPSAWHLCQRLSLQACQPGGTAAYPCMVKLAQASLSAPRSLNFGNTKGMVVGMQGARTRLGVSSLSKALEHPVLSHGKRPFWWYWARREEGKRNATGKVIQSSEIRRERLTALDSTKCRAPDLKNRPFHQITSNLMNSSLPGERIAQGRLIKSLEKSRKMLQIKIL